MSIQKNCGIGRIVEKQRVFFESGKTFDLGFRKAALKRLERVISELEGEICEALAKDLGKSRTEGYMCEVGLTLGEIREQRRNLRRWSRTERTGAGLANFPAKGYIVQEPYGTVLIMSPWNYPFMLAIEPLAGAIAAGNCCVIKPSAYSPATSAVIAKLIRKTFPEGYVTVIEGGRKENAELLEQRFDYIFFTGSVSVGKLVMEKAAAHLTPVSLELGGKEPLHCRQHGENPAGCTADCIRKIFKLRTDVCRAGLCSRGREREGGIIKGAYPLDEEDVR